MNGTELSEGLNATSERNEDLLIRELDAPLDLKLLSWPPRKKIPFLGRIKGYLYNELGGTLTYIYIIDEGIDASNKVRRITDQISIFSCESNE